MASWRLSLVFAIAWAALALADRSAWPLAGVATFALAAAIAFAARAVPRAIERALLAAPRGAFVGACAVVAAGVSLWFVRGAMRSEPVSIDAGVYLMQARAMAHGHFGMAPPAPATAFSARFLVEGPDARLYGVFPPGWPLALVPFVWMGAPMLTGPVVAALLVVAQAALGRAIARGSGDPDAGELATRASLLLSLPSYARAIETADLLSHAFVALLATTAIAFALGDRRWRGFIVGACVGWAIAARMLDGVVVAVVVGGVVAWRRAGARSVAMAVAGAAPFLALLAIEQRAATGAWMLPTQALYFERSDWPAGCHRLGFGADIGCTVEHPDAVSKLGGDGYGPRDALRVTHERTSVLGEDLLGFAPLSVMAFVAMGSGAEVAAAAFVMLLALAYGLFYYGNGALYGARHLFPAAPFVWVLAARAASRAFPRVRHAALAATLVTAAVCARGPWKERGGALASYQQRRSDLRRALAAHGIERGILKTGDVTAFVGAFDPWTDRNDRIVAIDDGSSLVELRRAHPDLPVFIALPGDDVGKLYLGAPPDEARVELERAWPAFLRVSGAGARPAAREGASGGVVLWISHAEPGAEVAIEIALARAGSYDVRIDGMAGPAGGDWSIDLDGAPLSSWRGFAPQAAARVRGESSRRTLDAGAHTITVRCTGRDPASRGYDAELDALVGVP